MNSRFRFTRNTITAVIVLAIFATFSGTAFCKVDPDFNPIINFSVLAYPDNYQQIETIALQKDGKILVAGHFDEVNGQPRHNLARLNPDGTLDLTFMPDPDAKVECIVLLDDGKILIGGEFNFIQGQERKGLARLNPDGTLDSSFVPFPLSLWHAAIAVQTDGKIVTNGGYNIVENGVYLKTESLSRLNPDGSLDSSFTTLFEGEPSMLMVVMQPDEKILVTRFHSSSPARVNQDGSTDESFQPRIGTSCDDCGVGSIVVQPDGKILIGGPLNSFTTK